MPRHPPSRNLTSAELSREIQTGTVSYYFTRYVVAVVDLLSQANLLEPLNHLPKDSTKLGEYVAVAQETVGRVLRIRCNMGQFFDFYVNNRSQSAQLASLTAAQQAEYRHLPAPTLKTQQFSDTIVAYSPLQTPHGDLTVRGAYGIMAACASTMLLALARGIPLRGGIDIAVGVELRDADLYGPALSHAHHLEHAIAGYPRIAVGQGLLDYIAAWEGPTIPSDFAHKFNRELARKCRSFIAADDDGVQILDYLGKTCRQIVDPANDQKLVDLAFAFVSAEHSRFEKAGDTKLAPRYARLHQYFLSRTMIKHVTS